MRDDPIVEEVRKVRDELAAKFNYDVKAIFDDLRNRQAEFGTRLVSRRRKVQPTPNPVEPQAEVSV